MNKTFIKQIVDDNRTIEKLIWLDDTTCVATVEDPIIAYEEPGQDQMVPWFAVYQGGEITMRVPAWMVCVMYETKPATK